MVNTNDLVQQIGEQEKKGFFKSLRKKKMEAKNRVPSRDDIISKMALHIRFALKITGEFKVLDPFDRIVCSGVGVNAVAGDILKSYLSDYDFKLVVHRDFGLPDITDNKTLVFILSYTGNDEEAISAYKAALRKGCKIIGLTSGGRLGDAFERNNTEHIKLPAKVIESLSMSYLFFPMLKILDNSKILKDQRDIIENTIASLEKPEIADMAKQLYEKIQDKVPVIYCSSRLASIARYWKIQLNLNAKVPAFNSILPDAACELNSYVKDLWDFYIIFLTDQEDTTEMRKSAAAAKRIIRNKSYGTTEINIKGDNQLARLFIAAHMSEYTAHYLGVYYQLEEELLDKYREEFKKG